MRLQAQLDGQGLRQLIEGQHACLLFRQRLFGTLGQFQRQLKFGVIAIFSDLRLRQQCEQMVYATSGQALPTDFQLHVLAYGFLGHPATRPETAHLLQRRLADRCKLSGARQFPPGLDRQGGSTLGLHHGFLALQFLQLTPVLPFAIGVITQHQQQQDGCRDDQLDVALDVVEQGDADGAYFPPALEGVFVAAPALGQQLFKAALAGIGYAPGIGGEYRLPVGERQIIV